MIEKQFLVHKYINEEFTAEQIADICSTSVENIRRLLQHHNIYRRKKTKSSIRKRNKKAALEYKGKKCEICGYDKCEKALQFHHVNPETKKFTISSALSRQWRTIKAELDKCILVCACCHIEIHEKIEKGKSND